MIGSINVLAKVLSVRWTVMMSVAGGIALAVEAMTAPDLFKLGTIGLYGLLVVLPVVWLAASGRG
jgi:hypothetical protein